MTRFRLRPTEVDAEPYRPGLEDEFTSQTVPVLLTPAGQRELAMGDWIVTRDNGEREVVSAQTFRALYERCSADPRPEPSERVNRGVPLRSG